MKTLFFLVFFCQVQVNIEQTLPHGVSSNRRESRQVTRDTHAGDLFAHTHIPTRTSSFFLLPNIPTSVAFMLRHRVAIPQTPSAKLSWTYRSRCSLAGAVGPDRTGHESPRSPSRCRNRQLLEQLNFGNLPLQILQKTCDVHWAEDDRLHFVQGTLNVDPWMYSANSCSSHAARCCSEACQRAWTSWFWVCRRCLVPRHVRFPFFCARDWLPPTTALEELLGLHHCQLPCAKNVHTRCEVDLLRMFVSLLLKPQMFLDHRFSTRYLEKREPTELNVLHETKRFGGSKEAVE